MTRTSALAAIAVLLLGASVVGQEPGARGRYAGWVRGDDGKRVVGADVMLLSRPLPQRPDIGDTDELHVQMGQDGMFRTELLHGRAYTAWATWRDADGQEHRTQVLEGVFPGPPLALEAAPAQTLRSIRIVGAAAWQAFAPLRVTMFTQGENVAVVPLTVDADMVAAVPTLPGEWCSVEVRRADGLIIGAAPTLLLGHSNSAEATLELSAPRELRVVVVDEQGAPVPAVRVRHAFGYHHRDVSTELGTTDADGLLTVTVPARNPMYRGDANASCIIVLQANGRRRVIAWSDLGKIGPELRLTMPAGITLTGRVLAADSTPVPGITLLPDCYAVGFDNETTGSGVPVQVQSLDGEGRFAFSSLHPRYDFRLLALLDPAVAVAAGMQLKPDVATAPVVWLAVGAPPFASPHDVGDIRFDAIPVAQIEVKTHAGVPVPGAHLHVTTNDLYNSPMDYICDRVGRLQFPLPVGEIRIGAWVAGGGVATQLVRVPVGDGDPGIDPLVITLSQTRTLRGVVVDQAGKPVAGARALQWDRAKTDDRQLAELTFLGHAASELTGADGEFTLTLPLADVPFGVRASARIDGAPFWADEVLVGPDDFVNERLRIVVAPFVPAEWR